MKPAKRLVPVILATALVILLLLSSLQWIAYEKAWARVGALPCNLSPAPYRLKVESFLPPKVLDRAVGHHYEDGELVALVPGRLGGFSPGYENLLWSLSVDLNNSISYLRDFLSNGSDEQVRMAFQVVGRNYLMLRLEREHCRKNLTAVVFHPIPSPKMASLPEVLGQRTRRIARP